MVNDLAAMKRGLPDVCDLELIALVDRSPRYSADTEALGEDFSDTRLYRLRHGGVERIGGGTLFPEITTTSAYEANTGDAQILRRFVRFGKATFPARQYALIVYSHGDGRRFGFDESDGSDTLDPGEVARALGEDESVDFLGLDVCSMGGLENGWRWRPGHGGFSAKVLVASAPVSGPWPYEPILARLSRPAMVGPLELGRAVVEELRESFPGYREARQGWLAMQSWAAYDLAQAGEARDALDGLLAAATPSDRATLRALRGSTTNPGLVHYGPPGEERVASRFPYIDLYDLANQAADNVGLTRSAREAARRLAAATDALVAESLGGGRYPRFEEGKHGLWVAFPEKGRPDGFDPSFCGAPTEPSPWCDFLGSGPRAGR